jgi:heat shock protein HspQ
MSAIRHAKFAIGQVVRHRIYPFRGLIFDIDPEFANTEEWWLSIPEEVRPRKDQPYYHLYAENAETTYLAYVSEQNLLLDETSVPLRHPDISDRFVSDARAAFSFEGSRVPGPSLSRGTGRPQVCGGAGAHSSQVRAWRQCACRNSAR